MGKNYLLALCILCFSQLGFSQDKDPVSCDSLKTLSNLTRDYLKSYNYHKGIETALLLKENAEISGSGYYSYHASNFLGVAYEELKDTLRAEKNYSKSLEYAQEIKNDTLILWAYNNLGNIYTGQKTTSKKGIEYYKRGIDLAKKLNIPEEAVAPSINIAWTYLDEGKDDKAFPYLKESEGLLKEKSPYIRSQLYMLEGVYFTHKREKDSAIYYFQDAAKIAEKDSLLLPASLVYQEYAKMYAQEGNYKKAYRKLQRYNEYNSKVYQRDKLAEIEAANARFRVNEYEKNLELARNEKQYQVKMLEESKEKMMVMIFSSLVLIISLLVLYKISRSRKSLIKELRIKNNELTEAKENAERLSLLKTKFFSTVSHELRTPLYGVVGLTTLLLEDEALKKHKSDLKALKFSADYLLALINDVLQMNKMESNQVKLENTTFNFRDLMMSIINTFEFTRLQNNNDLQLDVDPGIPEFLIGDSVRLSQVLMNLVGNAIKFTERGHIQLSARLEKQEGKECDIYFEVKDDGLGIPESKQKVIFEEFSQLRSNNYSYQGTGLGLTIVKKLLELFGSDIHLESEEGKGSKFSFIIHFTEDTKTVVRDTEETYLPPSAEPRKVLVVDDNRINQVVTRRILEKENFICDVAQDGTEAVNKAQTNCYDIILMDVNMPGISGMEATRRIRKFNEQVPVIALTAVEVEEIREKILKAGMNDIIVKPYDVLQFYQIINRNLMSGKLAENI